MAVLSRCSDRSDTVFLAEHWHPLTRDEANN